MPKVPNIHLWIVFQTLCPGTMTSAMARMPTAASGMLPITLLRSWRRRARIDVVLEACFLWLELLLWDDERRFVDDVFFADDR